MAQDALLEVSYPIIGGDFTLAGEGASKLKRVLQQIGLSPALIRRIAVSAYEAEMNVVIHAYGGSLRAKVSPQLVEVWAEDSGPGIKDIELAMTEGYSTAPDHVRALGFGAGMGLPNMRRSSTTMNVRSKVGEGTTVHMVFDIKEEK
ncbi:MAG: ATP-binding protein [bacterium]|nr:ATP-binding protein [bacterium]